MTSLETEPEWGEDTVCKLDVNEKTVGDSPIFHTAITLESVQPRNKPIMDRHF
jgi:hypothetical protein